jgi:hypothetical protein
LASVIALVSSNASVENDYGDGDYDDDDDGVVEDF